MSREELGSLSAQDLDVLVDGEGARLFDEDSEVRLDSSIGSRELAALKVEAAGLAMLAWARELRGESAGPPRNPLLQSTPDVPGHWT